MESIFTDRHRRYLRLAFCFLITCSILVAAQEDCVRSCTKNSGINECVGSIPHDDEAWNVLDASVQECYCVAAVNFAGCSPNCSTQGFTSDLTGRVFGQWRYVNQVCKSEVDAFTATASLTTNTANNTIIATSTSSRTSIPSSTVSAQITPDAIATPDTEGGTTSSTTVASTPTPTSTPLSTASALPLSSSTESSSSNTRTIAISVSLATVGTVAICAALWLLFRSRRRRQLTQNLYETRDAMVIVVGPDGRPVNPDSPNYPVQMRGDLRDETVKKWIEDQENSTERDAMTETLSVGYTLWTDTDLCVTEMGAEDSRDMETIAEDPDGEDTIRRI